MIAVALMYMHAASVLLLSPRKSINPLRFLSQPGFLPLHEARNV